MTRLVPRPDWTPVEFVLAVRAAVWEQGVTPETAANRPTVLALFRPAEEPEPTPLTCPRCGYQMVAYTTGIGGTGHQCTKCGLAASAPAAPPPAEKSADFTNFKASFDREWEANVKLRKEIAALRSDLSASQREVERLRQQLDPPTQSGSFGATTAKVAGKCIQCNGDIYHDPHHIGEYLHVCAPSGENRSEG